MKQLRIGSFSTEETAQPQKIGIIKIIHKFLKGVPLLMCKLPD